MRPRRFLRAVLAAAFGASFLLPVGAQRGAAASAETAGGESFRVLARAGVSPRQAERVRADAAAGLALLAPTFPGTPSDRILIVVHASAAAAPASIRALLHDGTAGLAMLGRNEIHLMLDEARRLPPNDLATVVQHELVHVLLDQYTGRASRFVSRWFHEGLAQLLSQGQYIGMSEQDLVSTLYANRQLPFTKLRHRFPSDRSGLRRAYAQSFSLVAFLERKWGLKTLLEAARHSTEEGGFRAGFVATTHEPVAHSETEWRNYVLNRSGATIRFVLSNCFSYVMIFAFVLLALAGIRRWRRDDRIRAKLEREDQEIELSDRK